MIHFDARSPAHRVCAVRRHRDPVLRLEPFAADPGRRSFLVLADGSLAGFVEVESQVRAHGVVHRLRQLLIMRRYRRRGIGTRVVNRLFVRLPGIWQIPSPRGRPALESFWHRVLYSPRCDHGHAGCRPIASVGPHFLVVRFRGAGAQAAVKHAI